MTDWQPDRELLTALHDAARRGDPDAYRAVFLHTCVVMPADPADAGWAVTQTPDGTLVLVFSSVAALRDSAVGAESFVVWPVFDLLYHWPDAGWSLLVDGGLSTEVLIEPEAVAALASDAAVARPLDAALWAADGDPEAYLTAILGAELVVPLHPAGSPSRDLTDPEFAWWREPDGAGIVVFSSPARLQARLGDVPWLATPFVDLLRHWPAGHDALVDPDHHIGVRLPAATMAAMAEAAARPPEATDATDA